MNDLSSFGVWVRRQRKALDLTQAELAKQAGCTSSMLRKIESNVRRPSRQLTARLATILGVPETERERFQQAARSGLPEEPQLATGGMPAVLPLGTVTFLMSDIEGSTRLWEQHPRTMQPALARHDALLRSIITAHGGIVLKSMGDGLHAVFASAEQALYAALAAQQSLLAESWETPVPLRARMALYAGKAELRDGDYFGLALSRAARLVATGYGGQILVSQTVVDQAQQRMPAGVELCDLGIHHLRDLHEPEHVYQLIAPELPSAFPMLSTPDARLADMPLQLSTLVGRAHEVAQLTALIQAGKRLLTLTGLGGVGKTRLALQVVTLVVGKYRDGVWFVDLAPATTVEQLLHRVAQALGLDGQPAGNLAGKILAWLSGKQALLLLDNLEQIPGASEPIMAWLRSAPGLTLLITSRVSLQLSGEQEFPIVPLTLPDLQALPGIEQLPDYGAVELFVLRAQDVRPDFVLSKSNAGDIAEICWRLDGLPLALELAAAWLRVFTPKQLLAQLQTRGMLRLLRHNGSDLPARQQTMQATLTWSYDLLKPEEQALLGRVAVFVSSWTVDMAEAACSDELEGEARIGAVPVLQLLSTLVEHNFIQPVHVDMANPRFRLLGAIREFAQEQLQQSGQEQHVRRRHALALFQLVSHTCERYERGDVDAFLPIHEELDNLRAALEWALHHGMIVEAAETVVRLEPFWASRMPVTLQWLEALLVHAAQLSPTLRARVMGLTALLSWEMFRDPAHARALCIASLELYRAAGDQRGIARALSGLAHLAIALGEIDEPQTEAYLAESLQVWRSLNDGYGIAETLIIQGRLASLQGKYTQARALMNEALILRRSQGRRLGIAIVLSYLGWLAFRQGNYAEMDAITAERMALERAMGNPQGIADCELWHGVAALWQGQPAKAAALLESSLARLRLLGEPRNVLHVLDVCAHAAHELGNSEAAQVYHAERIGLLQMLGAQRGIGWSHLHLGFIALDCGDATQARTSLRVAHSLFSTVRDQYGPTHLFADLSPRRGTAGLVLLIEGCAALAMLLGYECRALQLCAAATAIRTSQRAPFYFPDEQARVRATISQARACLEPDEFDRQWNAGWSFSLQTAVAAALELTSLATG